MAKKADTVTLDGKKMKEGGGSRRVPEGDYKVKITKAVREVNPNTDNTQIKLTLDILDGPKSSGTIIDYLTLTEKAMFRVGNLLDALGMNYPGKAFKLPLDKLVGKEFGVTMADDEYNGKIKSKSADYLDLETINGILDGSDVEDEDEDEDDEDLEEMDRDELKAYIKSNKLGVKVKSSMDEDDIRAAIADAIDDGDEDEDDDEDLDEFDPDEEL